MFTFDLIDWKEIRELFRPLQRFNESFIERHIKPNTANTVQFSVKTVCYEGENNNEWWRGEETNLTAVLEEPVDVDQDGEDKDGDGDHGGRVPWELVVRPRISSFIILPLSLKSYQLL